MMEWQAMKPKGASPAERTERLVKQATEAFAQHQIRKRSKEGRWLIQRIRDFKWDWTYAAEIICLEENAIFVGGDIGPMVFAYGPPDVQARIRWIGQCDDLDYYVRQKAAIGTQSKLSSCWDENVAVYEIDQFLDEETDEDIREGLEDAKRVASDGEHAVFEVLHAKAPDLACDLPHLGQVVAPGVVYAWAAVAKLCELLNKEERIPDYGDHMTLWKFSEAVESGAFNDYDGHGELATSDRLVGVKISPSHATKEAVQQWEERGITHIVWFNK